MEIELWTSAAASQPVTYLIAIDERPVVVSVAKPGRMHATGRHRGTFAAKTHSALEFLTARCVSSKESSSND
jgi:hypothetical protein